MTESVSAITRVPGFRAVGVQCGMKASGEPDLALILAEHPCKAAAVFTSNIFKAAPVLYDQALLQRSEKIQAVTINAGNANAITGDQGLQDAEQMARMTEAVCQLPEDTAFIMSTGVIGHHLPMDKIEQGIRLAGEKILTEAGTRGDQIAKAIMTTDLVPKEAFAQTVIVGKEIKVGGVAKGSGMIHPDMGTMLAVLVTNATLDSDSLQMALKQAVDVSFNRITIDGDTSTNDTALLLASGESSPIIRAGSCEFIAFCEALTKVCTDLAKAIARDGEGATKLLEVTVKGAKSEAEAETAAKAIATSPLTKTALFGNDPNWGRALAAVGRSGITVDPNRVSFWINEFQLVAEGQPLEFETAIVHHWLTNHNEIKLITDLGLGTAQATVWSCDFSYGYVEINAEYHT